MLKLSMKCWNSTFNARGPRLIIVVVKLGSAKIYVAAVEAFMQKERQDETEFTTKIDGFLGDSLEGGSLSNAFMICPYSTFLQVFFLNLTMCMTKLRVLLVVLCFSCFTDNSNILPERKINI